MTALASYAISECAARDAVEGRKPFPRRAVSRVTLSNGTTTIFDGSTAVTRETPIDAERELERTGRGE